MQIDDWNRKAVRSLLADADRALATPELEDTRAGREIRVDAMANTRKSYLDLMRRGRPLIMSDADQATFQKTLDWLTAILLAPTAIRPQFKE